MKKKQQDRIIILVETAITLAFLAMVSWVFAGWLLGY